MRTQCVLVAIASIFFASGQTGNTRLDSDRLGDQLKELVGKTLQARAHIGYSSISKCQFNPFTRLMRCKQYMTTTSFQERNSMKKISFERPQNDWHELCKTRFFWSNSHYCLNTCRNRKSKANIVKAMRDVLEKASDEMAVDDYASLNCASLDSRNLIYQHRTIETADDDTVTPPPSPARAHTRK